MSGGTVGSNALSLGFGQAAANSAPAAKPTSPFSLRLTAQERAYLEQMAGNRPLGGYIREQLLGSYADKRVLVRKPKIEDSQYAVLLAQLGHSHLSSNLNQLAKAANTGSLDVSENVEAQLEEAYAAVIAMRDALFTALGLKASVGK